MGAFASVAQTDAMSIDDAMIALETSRRNVWAYVERGTIRHLGRALVSTADVLAVVARRERAARIRELALSTPGPTRVVAAGLGIAPSTIRSLRRRRGIRMTDRRTK